MPPKDPEKYNLWRKHLSESAIKKWDNPKYRESKLNELAESRRTPEARKKNSESLKKYFENPEVRKKSSELQKKVHEDNPNLRKKQSEAAKRRFEDPEERKRNKEIQIKVQNTPEAKRKNSERQKKYNEDHPEKAERISELYKKRLEDPETHKKLSNGQRKRYENVEERKRSGVSQKKRFEDPINYEKHIIAIGGEPFWYGSSTINKDFDLYYEIRNCEKMKEWRKNVLLRDNYKDWFCGLNSNSKNHFNVHHIKPFIQIIEENNITSLLEAQNCKELWDTNNGVTMLKNTHVAYHQMW